MTHCLYLLRHAEAGHDPHINDKDRSLTLNGLAQAHSLGEYLKNKGISIDIALCSSAKRTQTTLTELKRAGVEIKNTKILDTLYNADDQKIREEMNTFGQGNILVITHNPGIHRLAHQLIGQNANENAVTKLMTGYAPATISIFDYDNDAPSDACSFTLRDVITSTDI